MHKLIFNSLIAIFLTNAAKAQCPDLANVTANDFCFYISWETIPEPIPDIIIYNGTDYLLTSGFGSIAAPAVYQSGGGLGACNSHQTPFSGIITINNIPCEFASGALPLTLLDFSVTKKWSNMVELIWTTTNEKNIKAIEILKSDDGKTWQKIKSLAPTGNNLNSENNYSAEDQINNAGKIFYRLQFLDWDGQSTLSDIVVYRQSSSQEIGINYIASNGNVILKPSSAISKKDILVYSIVGTLINVPIMLHDDRIEIDLQQQNTGIYLIKCVTPFAVETIKVRR